MNRWPRVREATTAWAERCADRMLTCVFVAFQALPALIRLKAFSSP